mmetsp:Transcript_2324/g.3853  ORF Transcript_2324/g.3853 Transcript_2324/m.3853 type:complete len:381 (+) Transcript_2324:63-1205(+)
MDGLVWKEYETDEGHKYYYNKLDASTTWEMPPDPDSADLNAPPAGSNPAASAALPAPMAAPAGTFAVKRTSSSSEASLLAQGATLTPPAEGDGVFNDYHKFVTQYADGDTQKELAAVEGDERKKHRHRRHIQARAEMLSDIKGGNHRSRLRRVDRHKGSRSSSRQGGGRASLRHGTGGSDFRSRADKIANMFGSGNSGGGSRGSSAGSRSEEKKIVEERKQLNKLVQSTENTLDAVKGQLKRSQEETKALKSQLKDLQKENDALKKENSKLERRSSKGSSSDRYKQKASEYEEKNRKLKDEVDKYKGKYKDEHSEKKSLEKQVKDLQAQIAQLSSATPEQSYAPPAALPPANDPYGAAGYDQNPPQQQQYYDNGADQWDD